MIPVFSNTLGEEELRAIAPVLQSRWVGMGKECQAFEAEFARHLEVDHVLLVNSGTSAIYVGLRALGIGPGDEVIISTINFVAVASAIVDLGARPVFADVDVRSLSILPCEIERLKTERTKAVVMLHYGGHAAPMEAIKEVCGERILLVEDAANAISSRWRGQACGTIGDMGIWSFDAAKMLVMADGGALYLREGLEWAKSLRYLGLAPKGMSGMDSMAAGKARWWEYDLSATSGKFISNDILAAVGRVQLRKLPGFIARRKEIWDRYQRGLSDMPQITLPPEPRPETTSSYYLYWIQMQKGRDELAHFLADNGVYTTFRYFPLHLVDRFGPPDRDLPFAEAANRWTLNLPLHQNLTDRDVDKIIDLVDGFARRQTS
jgi:dTDP-4-amino-4,6-dideoxygalactose transaminase